LSLLSLSPVMRTKGIRRVAGFSFRPRQKIVTGFSRHHHVREDQVGQLATDFGFALLGAGGGDHVVATHGEQLAHQPGDAGLVVDHQDAGHTSAQEELSHILIGRGCRLGGCLQIR